MNNGSITILKAIKYINPGYKTLQYTPNDGFLEWICFFYSSVK